MKIYHTETAMPQLIHLSKAEVEAAKKNVTKLYSQKKLTFIEKYKGADLYFEGDDLNQSWSLFHEGVLVYFVLAKKVQLFNGDAVRQTLVDRSKGHAVSAGIAQHVIFKKLIPKYHAIASDCQQSSDGLGLWTNLIGSILVDKPQLTVSLLNTNDKTEQVIHTPAELDSHHVWGESTYYQRFILVISENKANKS